MLENGIKTVVCLAPDRYIEGESPEYASWRARQRRAESGYGEVYAEIRAAGSYPETPRQKAFLENSFPRSS